MYEMLGTVCFAAHDYEVGHRGSTVAILVGKKQVASGTWEVLSGTVRWNRVSRDATDWGISWTVADLVDAFLRKTWKWVSSAHTLSASEVRGALEVLQRKAAKSGVRDSYRTGRIQPAAW